MKMNSVLAKIVGEYYAKHPSCEYYHKVMKDVINDDEIFHPESRRISDDVIQLRKKKRDGKPNRVVKKCRCKK
jgi:polyhydroxyalkanoate synthesis regulator phasin